MNEAFKFGSNPDYRTIEESRILDLLLLSGWGHELRCGGGAEAAYCTQVALEGWIDLGLPYRRSAQGDRLFDPAEVVNFLKWAGLIREDRFWVERYVATGRRLVTDMHAPNCDPLHPPPPSQLRRKRFEVTLEREFNLEHCPSRNRLRLRLPLPLEGATLRDLEFTIIPPTSTGEIRYSVTPGRLDAVLRGASGPRATLGVHASFAALPSSAAEGRSSLTPVEMELYTRPNEGLIQLCPRIRRLSEALAGRAKEPRIALAHFWHFIIDRLWCGVVHYDQVPLASPLAWVLDTGWFDCQLGSALLVGLCRARGMPARLTSGYMLYPIAPSFHCWAEVWLEGEGWIPLDLLSWDLSVRGRDVAWADYFFGALDPRLTTQCLPRLFTGLSPVRLPVAWHMLSRPLQKGIEIGFFSVKTGAMVYLDRIFVREPKSPNRSRVSTPSDVRA